MTAPEAATRTLAASSSALRDILLDAAHLPDWNPAFLRLEAPSPVAAGVNYPLRVRPALRGSFRYTAIEAGRIGMQWRVPGMVEDAEWLLQPVGAGTQVSHQVRRQGPLAAALRGADRGIAGLRLDRLGERSG